MTTAPIAPAAVTTMMTVAAGTAIPRAIPRPHAEDGKSAGAKAAASRGHAMMMMMTVAVATAAAEAVSVTIAAVS